MQSDCDWSGQCKWTTEEASDVEEEATLRVFFKEKCDSGGAAQEEFEMAANPDVKCQNSKYRKGLL